MDIIITLEFLFQGLDFLVAAAKKKKIRIVLFTSDKKRYQHVTSNIPEEDLLIEEIDSSSSETVVNKINQLKKENTVLGFINPTDTFCEVGLKVIEHFKFFGVNPEAVRTVRNKNKLRELCRKANLSPINTFMTNDLSTLLEETQSIAYPIIVKDNNGTSSKNVYVLKNDAELKELISIAPKEINYLIEPYLIGPLFSAESISFHGETRVLGFCSRLLSHEPYFMEFGLSFPTQFPKSLYEQIEKYIIALHQLIGFDSGFTHTEFILTKTGPVVVEINPRLGGAGMGYVISSSFNYNIYESYIDLILNEAPKIPERTCAGAASILLYANEKGVYQGFSGKEIVSSYSIGNIKIYPIATPGEKIENLHDQRACYAVLQAEAPTAELAFFYGMDAANKITPLMKKC